MTFGVKVCTEFLDVSPKRLLEYNSTMQRGRTAPTATTPQVLWRRWLFLLGKSIYEALHPETRRGGDRKSKKTKRKKIPFDSFAEDTARKTGKSARSVRMDLEIARDLDPDVKEIIAKTPQVHR